MKPIFQFLVWDNCKNNCKFCFQRDCPTVLSRSEREKSLEAVIDFLKSDRFISGSHILVCGGQIFDQPSDFKLLDWFFTQITTMMLAKHIDLLYLNTNLIYSDLCSVQSVLQKINANGLAQRLRFTTSYDLAGRFKSQSDRELMLANLKKIGQICQDIRPVVNIIMTKDLCQSILRDQLDIFEMMRQLNCLVNLVPYIIHQQSLAPSRNLVLKTLAHLRAIDQQFIQDYIRNITLMQEKKLYKWQSGQLQYCSCGLLQCGHSENFKRWSTAGTCFCCDIRQLFNVED